MNRRRIRQWTLGQWTVRLSLAFFCMLLPGRAFALRSSDPAGLRSDLGRARAALDACAGSAISCGLDTLPSDEQVSDRGRVGGSYAVYWIAARSAMTSAAKENDAEKRRKLLEPAVTQLQALETDLNAPPVHPTAFPRARRVIGNVLAADEFQRASGPTWFDRLTARVFNWLNRIFSGLGEVSAHAPWLPVALEWLCFAGAAAGLIVLAQRSLARQRLKVALGGEAIRSAEWEIAPAAWARDAEQRAAAGDWREAIRCLYWAAIVLLEDRRAWRHNPSRTPREYVRLLAEGSETQSRLRTLTGLFERVWYGLREAAETDYRVARESFDGLEREPAAGSR